MQLATMHLEATPFAMPSSAPKTRGCTAMHARRVLQVQLMQLATMLPEAIPLAKASSAPKTNGCAAMRAQRALPVRPMLLEMMHPVVPPLAPLATDITRCRAMCVRHALLVRQMSPGIMLLEPTPNAMQLLAPKTKGCAAMRV
jgi:hypothetical protein